MKYVIKTGRAVSANAIDHVRSADPRVRPADPRAVRCTSTKRTHLLPVVVLIGVAAAVAQILATRPVCPRYCVHKRHNNDRVCRRSTCSLQCFYLFLLDLRDVLLFAFETWPQCAPNLTVRISYPRSASIDQVKQRRDFLFARLGRLRIPYASVFCFAGRRDHEHILIRASDVAAVDRILRAALRESAARAGIAWRSTDFSIEPIRDLTGLIHYLAKKTDVRRPAPKGFRVCRSSMRFIPLSLKAGRIILRKFNAFSDDPKRRCAMPSTEELAYVGESVRKRYRRWCRDYDLDPWLLHG